MTTNILLLEASGATEAEAALDLARRLRSYRVRQVLLLQNGYSVAAERYCMTALIVGRPTLGLRLGWLFGRKREDRTE